MKKPQPPCQYCEDRQIGCHGTCDRYKSFRARLDYFNEMINERERPGREADAHMIKNTIESRRKWRKA